MNSLNVIRYAFSNCVAAAILAGCGISQPTVLDKHGIVANPGRGGSWIQPAAKRKDLVYATDGCQGVCIFSYPNGDEVGNISDDTTYGNVGICSGRDGNVFLMFEYRGYPNRSGIFEYAHGGTTPIATLSVPGFPTSTCSVDPKTGDLAVVTYDTSYGNGVEVFKGAQGTPTFYALNARSCGYDGHGNLFATGQTSTGKNSLSELIVGGTAFTSIEIDFSGSFGQVQWDGKYITIESPSSNSIGRYKISGSRAKLVGTTTLSGAKDMALSWIFGNHVIVGYATRTRKAKQIGVWRYPEGGAGRQMVPPSSAYSNLFAVTVSHAPPP